MYINKKTVAFKKLICAVRLIDFKAAKYINGTAVTKLPTFLMPEAALAPSHQLGQLFLWGESRQGHDFWAKLRRQLEAAEAEAAASIKELTSTNSN